MNQELAIAGAIREGMRLLEFGKRARELSETWVAACLPYLRNPGDAEEVRAIFQQQIERALQPVEELRKAGLLPARNET